MNQRGLKASEIADATGITRPVMSRYIANKSGISAENLINLSQYLNISPAGEQGILVEKCKVQFNSLTAKVSTQECNTSYVWLGNTSMGKDKLGEGANPNNNVITIK